MLEDNDPEVLHSKAEMVAKFIELFCIASLFAILSILVHNSENLVTGFKYLFYFIGSYLTLYRGLCIIEKILEICSGLSRMRQIKNNKKLI